MNATFLYFHSGMPGSKSQAAQLKRLFPENKAARCDPFESMGHCIHFPNMVNALWLIRISRELEPIRKSEIF